MRNTPLKDRQAEEGAAALCFPGTPIKGMSSGIWAEYSVGRGTGGGSYSLIFIPASPSQRKDGFLSLFSFDGKYHGTSA